MRILILADLRTPEIANIKEKAAQFDGFEVSYISGFQPDEVDFPCKGEPVKLGEFDLSKFDRKVFIKSSDPDFNERAADLLVEFPVANQAYRPFLWRKKVKNNDDLDDVAQLIRQSKLTDIKQYVLRYRVTEEAVRFLRGDKRKLYLNRGLIRIGFPCRAKKRSISDNFRFNEWSIGTDYLTGRLYENLKHPAQWYVDEFNKEMAKFGFVAERLEVYPSLSKDIDFNKWLVSRMTTDIPFSKAQAAVEKFNAAETYEVKVKVPGMMRGDTKTVIMDAKAFTKSLRCAQVNNSTVFQLVSKAPINLYSILPTLLETSQLNIKRFVAERLDYLADTIDGEFDFFDETCPVCGEIVPKNIFDDAIFGGAYCYNCNPLDADVFQLASAVSDDDLEADSEADAMDTDGGVSMSVNNDLTAIVGQGTTMDLDDPEPDSEPDGAVLEIGEFGCD